MYWKLFDTSQHIIPLSLSPVIMAVVNLMTIPKKHTFFCVYNMHSLFLLKYLLLTHGVLPLKVCREDLLLLHIMLLAFLKQKNLADEQLL